MFIRGTLNRRPADGTAYFTHRPVCSERLGRSVRQRTLLNLGRHFPIPREQWALVCSRIAEVVAGPGTLLAVRYPQHRGEDFGLGTLASGLVGRFLERELREFSSECGGGLRQSLSGRRSAGPGLPSARPIPRFCAFDRPESSVRSPSEVLSGLSGAG